MNNQDPPDPLTPLEYWEKRYQDHPKPWTGRPNAILANLTNDLPPGHALDLGCSEGNSTVWMAQQGWQVTGVDISSTALKRAAQHAEKAGVKAQTHFEQHDLEKSFPQGTFDLVYALYLQSPVPFDRHRVLNRASLAVKVGGFLLVIDHASPPSWVKSIKPTYPTVQQTLDALGLNLQHWDPVFVGSPEREVTEMKGPDGQTGTITDNIIFLQRTLPD